LIYVNVGIGLPLEGTVEFTEGVFALVRLGDPKGLVQVAQDDATKTD
jgi:hypothetical protein